MNPDPKSVLQSFLAKQVPGKKIRISANKDRQKIVAHLDKVKKKRDKLHRIFERYSKKHPDQIYLQIIPLPVMMDIMASIPLMSAFLKQVHYAKLLDMKSDKSFDILMEVYEKEEWIKVVQYLDPRLRTNTNLDRLNKKDLLMMIVDSLQKPCQLDNFFIQDLFQPATIFKDKYQYGAYVDLFMTAFYYILHCQFPSHRFPLKLKHDQDHFRFPMDVDDREFTRPTIIIDVANQFHAKFVPSNRNYDQRVRFLKRNILYILRDIYEKHDEPNLLIFFINQGDRTRNMNCPEIQDVSEWDSLMKDEDRTHFYRLLRGTPADPLDRHVLYITVPCHYFIYPELRYSHETSRVERPFVFNTGRYEPDLPYGHRLTYKQEVKNIMYDKYGRMLYLPGRGDEDHGRVDTAPHSYKNVRGEQRIKHPRVPYYKYILINANPNEQPEHFFPEKKFDSPESVETFSNRHTFDPDPLEGKNPFQKFVKKGNECSGHNVLNKNEIDDYMVGILMYYHHVIMNSCASHEPFTAKWLVFSEDNYKWMNDKIKSPQYIYKEKHFLSYIRDPETKPHALYCPNPSITRMVKSLGIDYGFPKLRKPQFDALLHTIIKINQHEPIDQEAQQGL